MTAEADNPDEEKRATVASMARPRRWRWARGLLTTTVLIVLVGVIGRQLLKRRWHTLYSRKQPGDQFVLAVDCPDNWQEQIDTTLPAGTSEGISIEPKPAVGFLRWWQQHIQKQTSKPTMHYQTLSINLTESHFAPSGDAASRRELMAQFYATGKSVMASFTTTKRFQHPLGHAFDVRMSFPPQGRGPTFSLISTTIYPDNTPANNEMEVSIKSIRVGPPDAERDRLDKEIIRRVRIVPK